MEQDIATMARKRVRLAALLPALLSVALIAADQVVKSWIVANIPMNTIASRYMGDFLWIVHARNLGIAFSIGDSISRLLRILLFIIMPAGFIAGA
ncbi:MAG: signal peptidase II, partial [Spirochaetales bacterium]